MIACGARDQEVNLEKTGKKYNTDEGVSFYYPSDFVINLNSKDTKTVEFSKNNNTLYRTAFFYNFIHVFYCC